MLRRGKIAEWLAHAPSLKPGPAAALALLQSVDNGMLRWTTERWFRKDDAITAGWSLMEID
jgi:hypothetical protein